jgi:hypothetical protein
MFLTVSLLCQKIFCFPLNSRLKAMYRSSVTTHPMTAWWENKSQDGQMRGPADSQVWKEVLNADWSCMSKDHRNVWLELAMDGLHPFGHNTISHSTWPILLVVYNLEPWRAIHRQHIILNAIIRGKEHIIQCYISDPRIPGIGSHFELVPLPRLLKLHGLIV